MVNKYEKHLLKEIKEFAINNGIPCGKMVELLILNAVRKVKEDIKKGIQT